MTNYNKTLKEKIADMVLAISLVGTISSGIAQASAHYPTLNQENKIVSELKSIRAKEFLAGSDEVFTKYSEYQSIYSKNLEEKIQEVRASPQYAAETQQKKEDANKYTLTFFCSLLLGIGAGIYGSKEERKRLKSLANTQRSGALQ